MVNSIKKIKLPFDRVINNARRLGLPSYISGFNWTAIMDLEEYIRKQGCTDEQEIYHELENYLIELQNRNYANNIGYLKKIKELNNQQKYNQIQSDIQSDIVDNQQSDIQFNIQSNIQSDIVDNEQSDIVDNEKSDIVDNEQSDIQFNIQSNIQSDIVDNEQSDIVDNEQSNSNKKKKKKKNKKNKKNKKSIKDEIDLAIKEIYEDENTENKIKLREKAEEKADRLERIKYKKMIKNLDKRVEDPSGNGQLDIIQANMNTKNDAIHEYFFHLREEFYKEHNKDKMFNDALIYLIKKNKDQFNKIRIITKCINVFFYEKFNVFKLYVYGDDPKNYSKIINATILISNLVHKLRTKLSNGKEFIRKAALAM
jgi:hypothetical protein